MIRSVLVAGGGSAGFLAALILRKVVPGLAITVIRSREIGVIGVGESTTVAMPRTLHGLLDLDPTEFYRAVLPSWKLGIRFLWGPRPRFDYPFEIHLDWKWEQLSRPSGYYCDEDASDATEVTAMMSANKVFRRNPDGSPFITRCFGYHIENQRFVAYLETVAERSGITVKDEVIQGAEPGPNGVAGVRTESGQVYTADLYIDCTGFRSLLLAGTLGEPFRPYASTLFCDRAVVGTWLRDEETIQPYTTVETMSCGWCWQIDHPDSIMRGYVYSSAYISDADAESEFRAKNPKIVDTRIVPFVSGRYERSWVKNVVAIGNAAGFVEPLESTALAVICDESRMLAELLANESQQDPSPLQIHYYNVTNARAWDTICDFLGIHYKFNKRVDNDFWRACQSDTKLGSIQNLVDYYRVHGPSPFNRSNLVHPDDMFGMEGYLTLLVGQKVPYEKRFQPTPEERRIWEGIRESNRRAASIAFSVADALQIVQSPQCKWVPGFFRPVEGARMTNYTGTVQ